MRPLFLALLALGFAAFASARDDKKELAREVVLKDAKLALKAGGESGEPVQVGSKDELAKVLEDKDAQDAIAKMIDFDTEYVLIFAWSGSGEDRLVAKVEKDTVAFSIIGGRTKDRRAHMRVYALAKEAKWSLAK